MPIVSENFHSKKLKNTGINIKTIYKNGNTTGERNTDNSKNEDINQGIRLRKEYYKDGRLLHTVTRFDTRMEYTYINNKNEETETKCPNCGATGKVKDFIDGCPYCRTTYNVEYTDKDLGAKYHYDRVVRSNLYRIITFIVDFLISFIICFIYFKNTSRTFNEYDILKVFVYTAILSAILYYLFYIIDAYIVILPIKLYKDAQNQKQKEFWNRMFSQGVDKSTFFNNINYEIGKYYYDLSTKVIDYDILDYLEYKDRQDKDGNLVVDVKIDIRLINFDGNKIDEDNKDVVLSFVRYKRELYTLEDGKNYIKCPNCGAGIDVTKDRCDHCRQELKYLQEWVMLKKD